MRKLIVSTFTSLDNVMQAPGGPTEDPTGNFTLGGWLFAFGDAGVDLSAAGFDGKDPASTFHIHTQFSADGLWHRNEEECGNAWTSATVSTTLRWQVSTGKSVLLTGRPIGGMNAGILTAVRLSRPRLIRCAPGWANKLYPRPNTRNLLDNGATRFSAAV